MLETKEARAKLRRKLETWPDDKKCPITINQALELLDMVEKLEHTIKCAERLIEVVTKNAIACDKEANWLAKYLINQIKICPTIKSYKCKNLDNTDFPVSECVKCWRDAVEQYVEWGQ